MKKLIFLGIVAVLLVSTSAQAVFTPPDLGNLAMWLDASGSVTKDASNNVSSWNDMTANGNDAVPANAQPLWVANGIGGQPVIRMTAGLAAASNFLQAPPGMTSGTGLTVLAVYKKTSLGYSSLLGAKNTSGGYGGSGRWIIMDSYSPTGTENRVRFQFDSANSHSMYQGSIDMDPHMQSFIYDGGVTTGALPWDNTVTAQFDDVQAPVMNVGYIWALGSGDKLDIGGTDHLGNFDSSSIDIAEVFVYTSALSQADHDAVAAYLGDKYGITVPEPATMVLLGLGGLLLRRRKA